MFITAARQHQITLRDSWMIGDILDDIEAGNRAGCRAILLDNGNETEWRVDSAERTPDFTVASINEACRIVVEARYAREVQ